MRLKNAFTLIELLVVIAIIAILAAIIFPVFSRAKDAAFRSGDIANMNAIRTALQLYKADQGGYPPQLLGYVTTYTPGGTDTVPAELVKGFLYPKRVDSINVFKPAYNKFGSIDITTAVWPEMDRRAVGQAPIVDTNGDGQITIADDVAGARQAYNYVDNPLPVCFGGVPCSTTSQQIQLYRLSGYDVTQVKDVNGASQYELRYALFWSNFAIGDPNVDPLYGQGSANDDPRQLGYNDPPDNTPITWNTYFRDFVSGQLQPGRRDLVVFTGGAARPFASDVLNSRSWRVVP